MAVASEKVNENYNMYDDDNSKWYDNFTYIFQNDNANRTYA